MSAEPDSSNGRGPSRSGQVTIQRLVVVGYILAVAMPPLGLATGLVLIISSGVRSKHGPWIVLASIVAAGVWALLINLGALSASNQGY